MGRTFSHEIRQEKYMILAQLLNGFLLSCIIFGSNNLIHPPFIAGSSTEHAAHQMIMTICMSKCMKSIVLIYTKFFRRDEDSSAGSQRNIASSVSYCSGSHSSCRIVTCSCYDFNRLWNTKLFCDLRKHISYCLIGLIYFCQLLFGNTADLHHFLGPAAVLYIKDQHTGCIGYVRAVYTG